MRHWMIVLAALGIMAVGLAASFHMFADETRLAQLLSDHVETQTGRRLSVSGGISVRFFPRFRIDAEDVSLSGPVDFAGPDLLHSESLSVEVRLWPLVLGRVETREVVLQGARLQLGTDEAGRHSLAGLMRRPGREGAPGIAASGPLRLEDLELELSDLEMGAVRRIQVDWIELDGLTFDRPSEFQFQGSVGRPPLFEDVSVRGILVVPAETGHFRLADMHVTARHPSEDAFFELSGALSLSLLPHTSFGLDGGRLRFNGQDLAVEALYEALARPSFSLFVDGPVLNPASLTTVLGTDMGSRWPAWLVHAVVEHDFTADAALDRLSVGPYELPDFRLSVSAEDGFGQLDLAETGLPGALVQGSGEVRVHADDESRIELQALLDVDDLGRLLYAGGFDEAADGAGQVRLVPRSETDNNAVAEARFEFFSGQLETLQTARDLVGVPGDDGFEHLTGRLLFYPDVVVLRSIVIRDEFSEMRLQAMMLRGSGRLSGTLVLESDGEIQQFQLGGSRARPELSPIDADFQRQ